MLKKKVPDALRMNDFENFFKSRLDRTYTDIKEIVEFQVEAEKVKNITTNLFKIEKERTRDISDQQINLGDFGISEGNTVVVNSRLRKADYEC